MISNVGKVINAGVNVKNWLIQVGVMIDLFGILVYEWICDKSCGVGEYLDFANCKCRKRLTDKLVQKCDEDIDGN